MPMKKKNNGIRSTARAQHTAYDKNKKPFHNDVFLLLLKRFEVIYDSSACDEKLCKAKSVNAWCAVSAAVINPGR